MVECSKQCNSGFALNAIGACKPNKPHSIQDSTKSVSHYIQYYLVTFMSTIDDDSKIVFPCFKHQHFTSRSLAV